MKDATRKSLDVLFERHPALESCRSEIYAAAETLCGAFRAGVDDQPAAGKREAEAQLQLGTAGVQHRGLTGRADVPAPEVE